MALEEPKRLPAGRDLPDSDGVPMEDDRHGDQARLYLIQPLRRYLSETGRTAFVSGNSFVYFEFEGKPRVVGPDVYVVNDSVWRGQSKWVAWEEEGRLPTLVIELLSPTTEAIDRGVKFCLYRDTFRCPDYFLFNTMTGRLEGFRLEAGTYVSVLPAADGTLSCSSLDLGLAVRDGWLRWILPDGRVLPTGDELAEFERTRAEQAEERARELEERLRRLQSASE